MKEPGFNWSDEESRLTEDSFDAGENSSKQIIKKKYSKEKKPLIGSK